MVNEFKLFDGQLKKWLNQNPSWVPGAEECRIGELATGWIDELHNVALEYLLLHRNMNFEN
jgi:hypothetical protein